MDTEPYISIFPEWEVISYGNFWQRLAAYVIDNVILLVPQIIVTNTYSGESAISDLLKGQSPNQLGWESDTICFLIYMTYFVAMELSPTQATLGKMALKLKVTGRHGSRLHLGQACAKYLLKYLCIPTLLVSHLMIFWDKNRQALHDKITGTFVVKKTIDPESM